MTRCIVCVLLLVGPAVGCGRPLSASFSRSRSAAAGPAAWARITPSKETRYLVFQLMTGLSAWAGPPPAPGTHSLSKAQVEEFVHSVVSAIGTTGDAHQKLGFAVGPLCFDMTDEETRRFIRSCFAVAKGTDTAVAFHIDDSMMWSTRNDLLSNPDNLETAGWNEPPNRGRRADWGPAPTRFPPQMCFNSPAIVAAVRSRAALIGATVREELASLRAAGRTHLFAGIMTGWETQIGRDFDTDRPLGYRALSHRGFSAANPPRDADLERVQVVKDFIGLWARSLVAAGVPRDRVFCHIAFTDQGLRAPDGRASYAEHVAFALPEVAFGADYRPGFSTYPEGGTFRGIYATLAKHGNPSWASCEGTNVSPTSMPGEPTMETYLGRMFNHGAVLVNIFSWGIGGEAMRGNFFRKATENPEALAAYAKFLRGETLVEARGGFSPQAFQDKMHRLQNDLPGWVRRTGRQAEAQPLMQRLDALLKERKWLEADKAADALLKLMSR